MPSGNGTQVAPYAVITSTDHGGQLLVVALATLTITVASVCLRIHISHPQSRTTFAFYKDDLLCFAAVIFFIIQVALVWVGIVQGNGKAIDLISPRNLDLLQRTQYVVDIFYIIVLFCSRASIIFLLERLQGLRQRPIWISSLGVLTLWFIASVFAVSLKCNLSHPWIQYNVQCTGLLSRWQAIEILGIISECAIYGLVIHLVYIGRMTRPSRVKILSLFATRIVVIVFTALRIAYLSEYFHSTNPTFSGVTTAIYALAVACASTVTTTTPLLKAFILKFKYHGRAPADAKAVFGFSITGRNNRPKRLGNRRVSLSEHEKPTASSSVGGEAQPGTDDNGHSV